MNPTPEKPGEKHLQEVMQDIACPQCEYNLRGLYGPVVNCPECGQACDIAKLITLRWDQPWWQAPGFNLAASPITPLVIGPLILMILAIYYNRIPSSLTIAIITGGIILGWSILMIRAYRFFNSIAGIRIALLAHFRLAGYVIPIVSSLIAFVVSYRNYIDNPAADALTFISTALIVLVSIIIFLIARRGERWIAQQCINLYLQKQSQQT